MNKATKRNVLASALLSIMLCVSLIAGATYALFTSESKVNVAVTSGKVDVRASLENLDLYSPTSIDYETKGITNADNAADNANGTFKNGGTAKIVENTLTLTSVTPGDKATVTIKVRNYSNVTVQYRTILACESDNGLFSGLNVTIADGRYEGETKVSEWTFLTPANDPDNDPVASFDVVVELPSTAGNEYQGKTCTISYTVEAVQGNAETSAPDPDTYYVYTATDLVNFDKRFDKMAIMNDIDMTGYDWSAIYDPELTIEGRGHKIIGLSSALLYTEANGNITINNLTIDKADILGDSVETTNGMGIAAFVAYMDANVNLTMSKCTVSNSKIIAKTFLEEYGEPRAAALVGYISDGSVNISNCKVENCEIKSDNGAAGILAHTYANVEINDCSVTGTTSITCTENRGGGAAKAGYLVSTVNAGKTTIATCTVGGNVTLSNNNAKAPVANGSVGRVVIPGVLEIDGTVYCASAYLNNILTGGNSVTLDKNYVLLDAWTPIAPGRTYTLTGTTGNGTGRFISGLTAQLFRDNAATELTIENITIKDSTISYKSATDDPSYSATNGHGAFISGIVGMISFKNCHLYNVKVVAPGYNFSVGGFVGQASGNVTIENCSVQESKINGDSSSAAFVGLHQDGMFMVTNGKVKNCTITSTDDGDWRVGTIVATVTGRSTATLTGCTAENVTLKMEYSSATNPNHVLWGRNSDASNASITIDGVSAS